MLGISIFCCLAMMPFNQFKIEKSLQQKEWLDYKTKYELEFSDNEDIERQETFWENHQFIINTNAKNLNYTLEMNRFGHLVK
ncbi:hypothetical protein MXB_737 [Myxobolus squamalis]|nr:hypothetical protein MXB_737 [Myxobolus squamalis]